MNRRQFVKNFTLLSSAASLPQFLMRTLKGARSLGVENGPDQPMLVVIELNGGVDGLLALIPTSNDFYYQNRPALGISADHALKINDDFGFHPLMTGFKSLWDQGELTVVQGVGYPNPNRSHFRSQDIWYTASPDKIAFDGWLGKYVDSIPQEGLRGVSVGGGKSKALLTAEGASPGIRTIELFQLRRDEASAFDAINRNRAFERLQSLPREKAEIEFAARAALQATASSVDLLEGQENYHSTIQYPDTPLATQLRTVARIMAADLGIRVFYVVLGGFDTHARQIVSNNNRLGTHSRLLRTVSDAALAFRDDLVQLGLWNRTLVMTFSEFGRRLAENASLGTDHGTANNMFLAGGGVKPGIVGELPSLAPDDLDPIGDMRFHTDFRQVYATVLENWLNVDSVPLLGEPFPTLELLA